MFLLVRLFLMSGGLRQQELGERVLDLCGSLLTTLFRSCSCSASRFVKLLAGVAGDEIILVLYGGSRPG